MDFDKNYSSIKGHISIELDILEDSIKNLLYGKNELEKKLKEFLLAPSKRLRPTLGYLFLKAAKIEPDYAHHQIQLAVELIHNATLIHDDVIDNSDKRRNQKTINSVFDDNLAVVAGDFLLSIAMEKIIETKSIDVIKFFTESMKNTCLGEISQYFSKFEILSIEDYIEKSKNKTALLFESAIAAPFLIENNDKTLLDLAKEFSTNFGIAFQIRDDLINIIKSDDLKPSMNDINSGIYTAPIIYAHQEDSSILDELTIEKITKNKGIEKTKELMNNYFDKSIKVLDSIEENEYKKTIIRLIEILRKSI